MKRMPPSSATPYSRLAPVYDHLMAHVEYEEWADYIHTVLQKFGNEGCRLLDAGCGSGKHMRRLRDHGYDVFGFDGSLDMVRLSAEKRAGHLWQGDLRGVAANHSFDAILCLYDTIHYLKEAELPEFFRQCHQALKSNGLLIFDAVTESFLREYWGDYTEWDEHDGWAISRRSWYDREERCQHTVIDLEDQASGEKFTEHHRQWSAPMSKLRRMGAECGFDVLAIFDSCTFDPGDENSDRNHFILKRGQN
jgi:SAM-dependent methyltransferase